MKVAALLLLLALGVVAEANRDGARGLLTHKKEVEHEEEEAPVYCSGEDAHDECPEYYECAALDEKVCDEEKVCTTNDYGKETCTYEEVCYEYACAEAPRYCDPYAKYDECEKEYGYAWECSKLDEKVCTYKDDCKQVKTDECKEYGYSKKCHYVQGPCKAYDEEEVCGTENVCIKYEQEEQCDEQKVCKSYHQKKSCKPNHKCAHYNAYGKCVKYGEDCDYKQGACKDYEYKKHNCRYVDTTECAEYEAREVDCKTVKGGCKAYAQVQKCDRVKGACKAYGYEEVCEQVEDVCYTGVCHEKPPPPPPAVKPKVHKSGVKIVYGSG